MKGDRDLVLVSSGLLFLFMEVFEMLKRVVLSLSALVAVGGCACLPGLPKCWLCAAGSSLMDTILGPDGAVGTLVNSLLGGLIPAV